VNRDRGTLAKSEKDGKRRERHAQGQEHNAHVGILARRYSAAEEQSGQTLSYGFS
jgi:hypothetical protein